MKSILFVVGAMAGQVLLKVWHLPRNETPMQIDQCMHGQRIWLCVCVCVCLSVCLCVCVYVKDYTLTQPDVVSTEFCCHSVSVCVCKGLHKVCLRMSNEYMYVCRLRLVWICSIPRSAMIWRKMVQGGH